MILSTLGRAALVATVLVVMAGATATAQTSRVLVLPLAVELPSAGTAWLGDGTAIVIADQLTASGVSTFSRDERVQAFESLRLPPAGALTRATMIRVGETIGASDLVVGQVTLEPPTLTIRVRMLRLDSGTFLPEVTERGPAADFFTLARAAATRVAATASLGPANPPAPRRPPAREAFERYVKGLAADSPTASLALFTSALTVQPDFDRARLAIWDVHEGRGDHAAALATVEAVSASSPEWLRAKFRAAWSLIELKRYDEAFERLTTLLSAGETAVLHNNLGVVQVRRGATPNTGRATYYFTRASDIDPDEGDYCFNLGYAYWLERDAAAATYWLREAVRRNPLDADAHFVLAAALAASGASVEAQRERELAGRLSARYEDANKRSAPEVPRGLERLKSDLVPLQPLRFDAAITAAAKRDSQELATFYLERGRRLIEQEQDPDALIELRRALYLSPYQAEAHLLTGRAYLRLGRAADAVIALRMSIWSHESGAAYFALAEALVETGDVAAARAAAQRALALDPGLDRARQLLARLPP